MSSWRKEKASSIKEKNNSDCKLSDTDCKHSSPENKSSYLENKSSGSENKNKFCDSEKKKDTYETRKMSDSTARGVIGMMALILIFQTATFTIHKCSGSQDQEDAHYSQDQDSQAHKVYGNYQRTHLQGKGSSDTYTAFPFNPNTITIDSLQMLGFSYKQALTIIRYREKGGKFRKKADFAKMYTVSPEKYQELEPYIVIPETYTYKTSKSYNTNSSNNNKAVLSDQKNKSNPDSGKQTQDDGNLQHSNSNLHHGNGSSRSKVYIDLNEADSSALLSVRGIGPYFCKAILSYRKALGSFCNIYQLLEIRGMDQEKFSRIKDQVFVHPAGVKKFSIAQASRAFLEKHPYIGAYNARGIALFLSAHSKEECTLKALVENKILTPEDTLKLKPYMPDNGGL